MNKEKENRNQLSMVQNMKLCMLIEKEYVAKKICDADFAKYASETLGFNVTPNQVYTRRTEFEIPIYRVKTEGGTRLADLELRVLSLEDGLEKLESAVDKLLLSMKKLIENPQVKKSRPPVSKYNGVKEKISLMQPDVVTTFPSDDLDSMQRVVSQLGILIFGKGNFTTSRNHPNGCVDALRVK